MSVSGGHGGGGERVAIVTLTIGDEHSRRWKEFCAPGWHRYAVRCGYELIRLTEPLDRSARAEARSPAWQKCLVLGHPVVIGGGFDRIVWIDADVVISPEAPPIADRVPPELVGAVDERALPDHDAHAATVAKVAAQGRSAGAGARPIEDRPGRAFYTEWGLPSEFEEVVQTGVMVLSPAHHRALLEDVYERYEDGGPGMDFEMRPLSWELLHAGVVGWLDPRFNRVWGFHKARHEPFLLLNPERPEATGAATRALSQVWMLHFAGAAPELDRFGPEVAAGAERPAGERPEPARGRGAGRIPRVETPVVLALYARPDTTARVLERIRAVRPARLFAFADWAPDEDAEAAERCLATRALLDRIDWDCELETDFADRHMGVRPRIQSGLDWVFERVPEAIVVEDDCLIEPSFFRYCDELLERYREDERVMCISGDRFGPPPMDRSAPSYGFSRYPLIWGWATWRRAWHRNDPALTDWPRLRESGWLADLLGDPQAVAYWTHRLDVTYEGIGSWDFAWLYSVWLNGGLCAVPAVNLVSNLGFRPDGAHNGYEGSELCLFAELATTPIEFPLRHPAVERDVAGDDLIEDVGFSGNLRRAFQILRARRGNASPPEAVR